jgi:hypothetical protein
MSRSSSQSYDDVRTEVFHEDSVVTSRLSWNEVYHKADRSLDYLHFPLFIISYTRKCFYKNALFIPIITFCSERVYHRIKQICRLISAS